MTGLTLYELLYASLDLPDSLKQSELDRLLSQHKLSSEELTMDNLREIVADLLHNLILEESKQESEFHQ